MRYLSVFWNYVCENYQWIFSGIGVVLLTTIFGIFRKKKKKEETTYAVNNRNDVSSYAVGNGNTVTVNNYGNMDSDSNAKEEKKHHLLNALKNFFH